jgi:hypothetical protein
LYLHRIGDFRHLIAKFGNQSSMLFISHLGSPFLKQSLSRVHRLASPSQAQLQKAPHVHCGLSSRRRPGTVGRTGDFSNSGFLHHGEDHLTLGLQVHCDSPGDRGEDIFAHLHDTAFLCFRFRVSSL